MYSTKRKCSSTISLVYVLFIFQSGFAPGDCMLCKSLSNLPNSKSDADNFNTYIITSSMSNYISMNNESDIPCESELPSTVKSVEDLISLLCSRASVGALSETGIKSAILFLTSSRGLLTVPLPPDAVVNLVTLFADSPQLFSNISQPEFNSLLTILTVNPRLLCEVPGRVYGQFLTGLFSMPPGALDRVPESVLTSVLGTVSSPDVLNALPDTAIKHLITVLSLSKSAFNCLPLPALLSLLTFVSASALEILASLPPSTVFGFMDGLLDTLDGSSPFLVHAVPTAVLATVLSPLMTARMLSVFPAHDLNLLLAVLGSSPALSKALPISNFISICTVLTTSPKILGSLDSGCFAKFLTTVTLCPSVLDGIPVALINDLLNTIDVYLPSFFNCMPTKALSVLVNNK